MDLMLQWFSQYFHRTTENAPEIAPDQLRLYEEQLVGFIDSAFLPEPTPEQRLRQSQRPEPRSTNTLHLSALMIRCAEGLSRCPQVAQALKTTPAVFTQVATQDLSLGGFIRALECLRRGAGDGVLRHAAAAELLLSQAQAAVQRYMKRPGLTRTQLKLATQPFHEPIQLWDQARAAGAVQSPYCPPPPQQPELEEADHADDQRMTQLLSELFADALSMAPPATAAAAPPSPEMEEKEEEARPRPQRAQRRQGLPIPGAAAAARARRRKLGRKHEGPT